MTPMTIDGQRDPDRINFDWLIRLRWAAIAGQLITVGAVHFAMQLDRSEEHTSELPPHRDLPSFPTRRSSDLDPDRINFDWLIRLRWAAIAGQLITVGAVHFAMQLD